MIVVRNTLIPILMLLLLSGCGDRAGKTVLSRGIAKLNNADYVAAVRLLENAVLQDPSSSSAYCNLGVAYWRLERRKQAVAAFEKAAEFDETDTRPLEFLANLHGDAGEWGKARDAIKRAIVRVPDSPRIITTLAVIELRSGNVNDGYDLLMQALDIDPEYLPALYDVAILFRDKAGNNKLAGKYFQKYLDVAEQLAAQPEETPYDLKPDRNRIDAAKMFLAPRAKVVPPISDPLLEAARAAIASGEIEEALVMLKSLVEDKPQDADPLWELAVLYDKRLQHAAKATSIYRSFSVRFPDDKRNEMIPAGVLVAPAPPAVRPSAPPPQPKTPPTERIEDALVSPDEPEKKLKPPKTKASVSNKDLALKAWADGWECHNKKDVDGAILHYKRALGYDAGCVNALYNIGLAYIDKKEFESAKDAFTKTLVIRSEMVRARAKLGLVYARLDNNKKAVEILNRALRSEPDNAEANYYLGVVYMEEGREGMAKTHLSQSVQVEPSGYYGKRSAALIKRMEERKKPPMPRSSRQR